MTKMPCSEEGMGRVASTARIAAEATWLLLWVCHFTSLCLSFPSVQRGSHCSLLPSGIEAWTRCLGRALCLWGP